MSGSKTAGIFLLLVLTGPGVVRGQSIAGCRVFPPDNIWNVPVDRLPVDRNSDDYVASIGAELPTHPDFGSGVYPPDTGGPIGIPFVTVPANQPGVEVSFLYRDESDPGPYPIPPDPPIEGGPEGEGDRHVLILERERCRLYELFNAFTEGDGSWRADSGAIFDLNSNRLRPEGWTSADAAGLPILPGLVRYDEVASGEIRHALRFTAPDTRQHHVWPARHDASDLTASNYPPMGQRFRLRGDFDISGFDPEVRVILRALQVYGMMLADNGSAWFLSGVPDERWDNETLRQLRQISGSDFEAVDVSTLQVEADSGRTRVGETSFPEVKFLPQVGAGRFGNLGFATRFIFVAKNGDASIRLNFFDPSGLPLPLGLEGAPPESSVRLQLQRGQIRVLQSAPTGAPQVGYARIESSVEIGALAILSVFDASSGVRLSETAVPLVGPLSSFFFPMDSLGHADTGVALAHPAGEPPAGAARVTVKLYSRDFELLAEADLPQLAPGNHRALFVSQLFDDPAVAELAAEMEGLVSISSDRPLAALVLRRQDDPALDYPADVPTLTAFPVFEGAPDPAENQLKRIFSRDRED